MRIKDQVQKSNDAAEIKDLMETAASFYEFIKSLRFQTENTDIFTSGLTKDFKLDLLTIGALAAQIEEEAKERLTQVPE
jgi:hypothetical protein